MPDRMPEGSSASVEQATEGGVFAGASARATLWMLDPRATIRRSLTDPRFLEVIAGMGTDRTACQFSDARLVNFLLTSRRPAPRRAHVESLASIAGLPQDDAQRLIKFFADAGILVSGREVRETEQRWEISGWRDALDFHLATQDLTFNRDHVAYVAAMNRQIQDAEEGSDAPSPGPYKYYPNAARITLDRTDLPPVHSSVAEVLEAAVPFRSYQPGSVPKARLSQLLLSAYSVTSEHTGLLGQFFRRAAPSGGARHPVEVYVCINRVDGLSPGVYHYLPREHALEELVMRDVSADVTRACFQKPGIESASAVMVLTVRWSRHMWKYRYARSYRMVLFDLGHLIQTHILAAVAFGIQSFPCPSIDDDLWLRIIGLDDARTEGVMYAIGIGPQHADPTAGANFFPSHEA